MIKSYRDKYNSEFSESAYKNFIKDLDSEFNFKIEFRIAETPVFLPDEFVKEILKASDELLSVLQSKEFAEYSKRALPEKLAVPNEDKHASLLSIDFAICKDDKGNYSPQLIELQGFASLYCYQQLLSRKVKQHFNIDDNLTNFFNGYDYDSYIAKVKESIVADADPKNVILLEIEPEKQKTNIDFLCTEKYIGVKSVCLSKIIREGKKLFYESNGKKIPVHRIYNRVIHDELVRRSDIKYNFKFTDELDVKWIAHPNWFFKISKYTLPFLKSKYVPDTRFLNEVEALPEDLENYVLKPLYSFAGSGVIYDIKKSDIESINDRSNYILQRKINYEPVIKTPDSPAKAELRLLYLWDDKPLLLNNLVRLSKGKMMGVDFNKDKTWVGSSIAFFNKQIKS